MSDECEISSKCKIGGCDDDGINEGCTGCSCLKTEPSNDLLCFLATERDWALSNKIAEMQDLKEDAAMWSSGYQSAIESVLAYISK